VVNIFKLLISVFFIHVSSAQPILNQGKVVFGITYKNLPPVMVLQQKYLPKQTTIYFKDSLVRIELGSTGSIQNITIQNTFNGVIYVLLNLFDKKYALIKHDSDLIAMQKELSTDTIKYNKALFILDSVTRNIAGYKCIKAVSVKTSLTDTVKTECWFTKNLPALNVRNNPDFNRIPGFLMQYSATENGITTTFTAKSIVNVLVDDAMFKIPQEYELISQKDFVEIINEFRKKTGNSAAY